MLSLLVALITPFTHPALDQLFENPQVMRSPSTLKHKGFKIIAHNPRNGLVVATHKKMADYVFKIFPDSAPYKRHLHHFEKRVRGSRAISAAIRKHGWQDQFFAPKKWIYPIDDQRMILVAEKVDFLSHSAWRSKRITATLLSRLHTLINEVGMADSLFPDNIPLCRDGRIAFIDTEHNHNWGIPYSRLLPYLTPPMQAHWNSLH